MTNLVIPTLATERLRLRPLRESDVDDFNALHADPEVMRHLMGPWTPDRAWRSLAFLMGYWLLGKPGMWAVEQVETGGFLGIAGFYEQEGGLGCELNGRLARAAWGHGYATEAGRALLDHAFTAWNMDGIIGLAHPENHASIRAAQRLGGTLQGRAELNGRTLLRFGFGPPASQGRGAGPRTGDRLAPLSSAHP